MSSFSHLPPEVSQLAMMAHELAPTSGISPWLVLGLAYAESNFGKALKPPDASGSGDFIPRPSNPVRDAFMEKFPLPGVEKRMLSKGIPSRAIKTPVIAWVPTTHGWGVGVFQIDYEAHRDFIESGKWKDVKSCMRYAIDLLSSNRKYISKSCAITGEELDDAMIASYNAGAGRVAKFVREDKDLDGATFHPGYIGKIKKKADELSGTVKSWLSPTTKVSNV
jgi:hypothetical protein